ncbi:hypothetical protein [Streptomyces sp. NPDC018045]|uniref:hypothetical protein n=1 Tax=Streptomyces sp. NPDC018045 TaxID=3365037 RepID=UPI00379D431C
MRKARRTGRYTLTLAVACTLAFSNSTMAQAADITRPIPNLYAGTWLKDWMTTSEGKVTFKRKTVEISAMIYMECSGDGSAYLQHYTRGKVTSPTKKTTPVYCPNGNVAEWTVGVNDFSETHGESAMIRACISMSVGSGCSDWVEVREHPKR